MTNPLILFAYANNKNDKYLSALMQEIDEVINLLFPLVRNNVLNVAPLLEEISSEKFFKSFINLRSRVEIIHFGGHADREQVQFTDGSYKIRQFTELLKGQHQLKLVFLNGCSTEGLVDALLQQGVKAVIATNRKVDDRNAADFAINFYKVFSQQDISLENAFANAASNIKKWEGSKAPIYRDRTPTKKEEKQKKIPWGLYLKEENKEVLQWALNDKPTIPNESKPISFYAKKWRELVGEYQEKEKLKILNTKKLNRSKYLVGSYARDKMIQEAKDEEIELEKIQNDIDRLEEEKTLLLKEISTISNKSIEKTQKKKLQTALSNINFTKELNKFIQYFFQRDQKTAINSGGFIVSGSPKCGLELLKNRLLQSSGLINKEHKVLVFDFKSKWRRPIPSKVGIWLELLYQLEKEKNQKNQKNPYYEDISKYKDSPELYNKLQKDIRKKIFEKLLKVKDVILIFNNTENNTLEQNKKIIEEFWYSLLTQVENYKAAKTFPTNNGLYLIFIDNNCHLANSLSPIKRNYDDLFNKTLLEKNSTFLLPMPGKIQISALNTWARYSNLPLIRFDEFIKPTGDYVLPTIKSICINTKIVNYEECGFPRYDEKSPNVAKPNVKKLTQQDKYIELSNTL